MTTRPRMPGAKHDRVEKLRAQVEQEERQLYYIRDGKRQPKYAPALMQEKEKEIVERFDKALQSLMLEADAMHTTAGDILARASSPYSWLSDTETARAATLAPFIREDLAAVDAAGLLNIVQSAAGTDKVNRWLIYRYAEGRYRELDTDVSTALGMGAKVQYEAARNALRDDLMPADKLRERKTAEKQQAEAAALFDAAEWARPEVRRDFAARAGVDVQYLP